MLIGRELRDIADFVDAAQALFEMTHGSIFVTFDEDIMGGYLVYNKSGDPLGAVQVTDSGAYEFVPTTEE